MTQQEIILGSKLIAEYLGFAYLPFSAELKCKPGWWVKVPKTKRELFYSKINGDVDFICRRHLDLDFYYSLDALIPAIKKIEKEKINIRLDNNGCHFYFIETEKSFESYDLPNWSNNVFKIIVEYLKTK